MNQESGMPKAYIRGLTSLENVIEIFYSNGVADRIYTEDGASYGKDVFKLLYPIGVTDNSNLFGISKPKQELYLGDLIGFNLDKKDVVGVIVWLNFSVWVRLWRNENWISYLSMSHVLDYFKIKKLGSRYTHPEILRKAGLEEPWVKTK